MSPNPNGYNEEYIGFPRSRGDEPIGAWSDESSYGFSPLTRG